MPDPQSMAESAAKSNARAKSEGWFATSWATMERADAVKQSNATQPPKRDRKLTPHQIDILRAISEGASTTGEIAALCTGTTGEVAGRSGWLSQRGLIRILVGKRGKSKARYYYITDAGKEALEREGKL